MALTEETLIDQVTADEYGNVSIRESTRVFRNGQPIGVTYHRRVIAPDAPLTAEDARVRRIAEAARQDARPRPTATTR